MNTASSAPASVRLATPDPTVDVSLVTTGLEKDRFIKFAWEVYRNEPHWIPPLLMERHEFLDPAHNPFYLHADVSLFLATRNGQVVGRIAAVEDRNFNAFHGVKKAYFGMYESIDDPGVAAALMSAVKNWARWRGLDAILGPMNLSTNYECGLLVEGFEHDPYFMMPYNPRYYADLFAACGLVKAKDLFAFERSAGVPPQEKFARIAQRIQQKEGITLRSMELRNFEAEIARMKAVYNSAWEKNWGFVPMTDAEFDKLALDLKRVVVPDLALIAEDHGEPIAFGVTIPDMNQAFKHLDGRLTWMGLPVGLGKLLYYTKKIDQLRLMALGVKQGWRRRGVEAVLVVETIQRAHQLGYRGGEISWTLEDNDLVNRAIEAAGCTRTKTYRIYEAPVE